ncbi:hypothetical protein [Paenibacillus terrae]|uniref:hypothetical protein n=1 Tax=Paenibacillus terrae TaxID=159743 RepID=UPI000A865E67|nr:hypothetical protein [Paenibacillus terrae]
MVSVRKDKGTKLCWSGIKEDVVMVKNWWFKKDLNDFTYKSMNNELADCSRENIVLG